MDKEIKQNDARLLVVTLSNGLQVHPDRTYRKKIKKQHQLEDLFYPDRRIQKFCEQNGIDSMMLAPLFQRSAEENGTYFHGFKNSALGVGHWNEKGHHLAGKIIAKKICTMVKTKTSIKGKKRNF